MNARPLTPAENARLSDLWSSLKAAQVAEWEAEEKAKAARKAHNRAKRHAKAVRLEWLELAERALRPHDDSDLVTITIPADPGYVAEQPERLPWSVTP